MDQAPWFEPPDQFDQRRIRLADIDGSGTTDIIYLAHDGVRLYFNQSGNAWSEPQTVAAFPPADDLDAVQALDLLGNGTACLVWSSPLPGDAGRSMRYIDLMGGNPGAHKSSERRGLSDRPIHFGNVTPTGSSLAEGIKLPRFPTSRRGDLTIPKPPRSSASFA
jgi:hypothetical protein